VAVLAPLVVAAIMFRRGTRRALWATLLTGVLAAVVVVAGLTAGDAMLGRSVLPWAGAGGTFVSEGQLARLTGSPCADGPSVRLSPTTGVRTAPITVTASCFGARERVEVRAGGPTGKVLATFTADRQGYASGRVRLPAGATGCRAGACELVVRGVDGGHQQSAPYAVAAR
jgi:hypothetical protein